MSARVRLTTDAIRQLARTVAEARGEGLHGYLDISPRASPAEIRDTYLAYRHLHDTVNQLAADMYECGESLQNRIILAGISNEVEAATKQAWDLLKAVARSGGRGVPCECAP